MLKLSFKGCFAERWTNAPTAKVLEQAEQLRLPPVEPVALGGLYERREEQARPRNNLISIRPESSYGCGRAHDCGLFYWDRQFLRELYYSFYYNQSSAKVVSSKIGSFSSGTTESEIPEIAYSFSVDGREYTSNRYELVWGRTPGEESPASIVSRYKPGDIITISYSRLDPHLSVINPALRTAAVVYITFLTGAGLLMLLILYSLFSTTMRWALNQHR